MMPVFCLTFLFTFYHGESSYSEYPWRTKLFFLPLDLFPRKLMPGKKNTCTELISLAFFSSFQGKQDSGRGDSFKVTSVSLDIHRHSQVTASRFRSRFIGDV